MTERFLETLNVPGLNDNIEVFKLHITVNKEIDARVLALLSPAEIKHAMQYRQHEDKWRFMQTRAVLRHLLSKRLGVDLGAIDFVQNRYGKPYLAEAKRFSGRCHHFNVSHSGQYALIALSSKYLLGVDVEYKQTVHYQSVLEQWIYSEQEHKSAKKLDFYTYWTSKEAVLKALGIGVGEHLQDISIVAEQCDDANKLAVHSTVLDTQHIELCRLSVAPHYAAALAWKGIDQDDEHSSTG